MMNWKGFGRKGSWSDLRHYPRIFLVRLRNTTKIISQDNRCPRRHSNQAPPKHGTTARPDCSMFLLYVHILAVNVFVFPLFFTNSFYYFL
jgi:hypothetical protein